jgi:hypothetical protein
MPANLGKLLHTANGKIIMSILLGLGLASLFRTVCKDRKCVIFNSAPLDEIHNKIYKYDKKCYKYDLVSTKCNSNKNIVEL